MSVGRDGRQGWSRESEAAWERVFGVKPNLPDPSKRKLRCGPWVDRGDGIEECQKCGRVDLDVGEGPMGF